MKKIKNSLALLLVILMVPVLVIGCKPKVPADQSAKYLFNFLIKGDKTGLSKMGAPEKDIDNVSKKQKEEYITQLKTGFTSQGLTVSDEQVQDVYKAFMTALKRMSVDAEIVSQKDKTAQVKVQTSYCNLSELSVKAATDATNKYKNSGITDRQKLMSKLTNEFIKNLISELEKAKPASDKKEKTFKFVVKDNVWMPESSTDYCVGIMQMISGQ